LLNINNFQLIVYDFDGVMTDNKVYVDQNGNEMVQVNRADGLGVSEIKKLGIDQLIISTEKNPVVSNRAKKLGIPSFFGIDDKKSLLLEYCSKKSIDKEKVIYIGNDINDKHAIEIVGYSLCPSDSHQSIIDIVDYVLNSKGGSGVIREFLDFLN
tara:strand:- start:1974 stop:2438 length:465 start_codon:yes stop_codon:yes gene_type:complete